MKTKQVKDDTNKTEDDSLSEPKTRARKKASDANEEAKSTSEESKITVSKRVPVRANVIAKKGPLGLRKTLRSKKVIVTKDKQKNVVKKGPKRGRKPAIKTEPVAEKEPNAEEESLIPASEIKKEPVEEVALSSQSSRSSSPKTAGRRPRLSSDMIMMKSVLSDTPSTLVVGSRTSPYSTRSERSNSPSIADNVSPRRGKPRKIQNNLRNEVVIKEQNKRMRLPSESKSPESPESNNKRAKRGRSCSRDGSEISKCSDITESDISLNEPLTGEIDSKELNKKLDKPKTELDIDNVNVQISSNEQVPFETNIPLTENKTDDVPSSLLINKPNKPMSLKRSTSLDSDNNNSNRIKLETFNSLDIDDKASLLIKTGNDTLSTERSSILTSMFKTFNSKEVAKNIRKARRGRKATTSTKPSPSPAKSPVKSTNAQEEKIETVETLSKEIDELIKNLSQDQKMDEENQSNDNITDTSVTSPVNKPFGLPKPLTDSNSLTSPDIVKDKAITEDVSLQSIDDSENIKLHFEDDSEHPAEEPKQDIPFKCTPVATIDKLMDRLKEFEELDKKRQRQESESKSDAPVMVTNDVVLIPKSGDIKMLKDHKNLSETMKSPERPVEKENVLSCFQNNSAISIVKRDHIRKSVDVDLTNSISLIKRNSISRKESTGSNNSRESNDAISIFEKSLGKDVTLTEIRKSVDKPALPPVNLLQLATLHPNKPGVPAVAIVPKEVSITPRVLAETKTNCSTITKRKSRDSLSRKSSESGTEPDDKMATLEKIISPVTVKAVAVVPGPVAVKSPETQPMEIEPQAPPIDIVKPDLPTAEIKDTAIAEELKTTPVLENIKKNLPVTNVKQNIAEIENISIENISKDDDMKEQTEIKDETESKISESADVPKSKSPNKASKSARNSTENEAGPSNILQETPESQKHKESVLRTLGLLTHKAAKEAKIEKAKEKERIYGMASSKKAAKTGEYTGTLKTVIKLNRNSGERDKKKHRSSLKMTFQKSKVRSGKQMDAGEPLQDEYYTIERKEIPGVVSDGGHRKSHYSNRLNHDGEAEPTPEVKEPTLNLVIPEKASSFSIHPGRLCMDQCFYCGGKFGLFDTPCHIAQMKSADRQKKVLDNEEKLTIDSCLCDACYRHVDRRANCPSYRKRPGLKQTTYQQDGLNANQIATNTNNTHQPHKPPSLSPPIEEVSSEEGSERTVTGICHVEGCTVSGDRYIRRKWLIKMRQSVNKVLRLRYDYPGLQTIPLCSDHYRLLSPLTACNLCRRSLLKHHNVHFIHHGYMELNPLLKQAGVPVEFSDRPVLCKMCRDYCTLLQKPGNPDQQQHAYSYRRRLLQLYNIEVPPEIQRETDDITNIDDMTQHNKQRKKSKTKHKQRKSGETDRQDGDERLSESPNSDKKEESNDSSKNQNIEEDIESLISSNKILIPVTTKEQDLHEETQFMDKQTELQYLLQKQNNPAQFLNKPNMTQKKNMMKFGGVQKSGLQQRIFDKNARRIQKLGQIVIHKDTKEAEMGAIENITCIQTMEVDKSNDVLKTLSEECTIETVPNKKQADINMLKNKWQMSESFTQVKKNLSELSKKLTIDKTGKSSETKYSNPVKRLETNPSISVRELFPGEEEMNLQCNIEFNTVKGVTPEGWEKSSSTIQYDNETKKLWNDLQKPYGNQSSFLRHLVLLERYFRNGDLVLSPNANPAAVSYSDSVQTRLKAFDNVPTEKTNQVSLIDFRKKPNSKSLLKTNQPIDKDKRPPMPPPGIFPKPKQKDKPKSKPLPPELIAINTPNAQGRKAIQNVLHNIQQLVKGVSASDPVEVASSPIPVTSPVPMPVPMKVDPPKEMKVDTPKEMKAESIKKDASKKQKNSSKPWRPTLMPITPENLAKIAREPHQTAVDGRSLPSLVQVKASGQRYHITIQDYNKMCIMRRDKLQQLHDGEKSKRPSIETEAVITEIQPSVALGNGGTMKQTITSEKLEEKNEINTQMGNAATILKNVGLKNITIAPIPAKTSTVTSLTVPSPIISSPSLLVASSPMKLPQLGPAVSITSEAVLTPNLTPIASMGNQIIMPKIPRSLTVIPQSVAANNMGMATLTSMATLNSMQSMTVNNVVVTPSDVNRL